jgi:predicted ATP-dependent endonuclease of OLD family
VFIRKILEILPNPKPDFQTQLIATTHSPHIIYESNFMPIRYFCRASTPEGPHLTDVKNLSTFYQDEPEASREFLQQYIKLTHCDLFFADAAVLVEGNVERLLLPVIIEKFVPDLRSCHLTILEVGGAFAHRFENLVTFLDLPTLVITDLDSVLPAQAGTDDGDEGDDADGENGSQGVACTVDTAGAVTSNETLKQWLPKLNDIGELLASVEDLKAPVAADGSPGRVRVAYQTAEPVTWQGETKARAGRTLEEAFALQNLGWTQSADGRLLGLKIAKAADMSIEDLHDKLFARIKTFDKTRFALGVIAAVDRTWTAPRYIVEGLEWLSSKLELVAPDLIDDAAAQQVGDR